MKEHREWYTEYIETEEDLESMMAQLFAYAESSKVPPYYRGQSESNWMIVSTFYREFGQKFDLPSVTSFSDLNSYMDGEKPKLEKEYSLSHDNLITDFISCCWNELDIKVTHPEAPALLDSNFYIALAQHYGVPTNLLDFTLSPSVALFFAFSYKQKEHETDYVALYQTHPIHWVNQIGHQTCSQGHSYEQCIEELKVSMTEYNYSSKHFMLPRLSESIYQYNSRINRQLGKFYFNQDAIPYDLMMYRMKERFPYPESPERRILINRRLKGFALQRLKSMGINSEYIYPPPHVDKNSLELIDLKNKLLAKYK